VIIGSRAFDGAAYWPKKAEQHGFEVRLHQRSVANNEKCVDTDFTTEALVDCYEKAKAGDEFVLVAGDLDYLPLVTALQKRGILVTLLFWEQCTARRLRTKVDRFISMESYVSDAEDLRSA
jgi:uncharacterized LabA/DUF88 family protein